MKRERSIEYGVREPDDANVEITAMDINSDKPVANILMPAARYRRIFFIGHLRILSSEKFLQIHCVTLEK